MDETENPDIPSAGRTAFILVIWPEQQTDDPPIWRGALESGRGVRRYFRSLQDLNRLLYELGGWVDHADPRPAGGQEPKESKENQS